MEVIVTKTVFHNRASDICEGPNNGGPSLAKFHEGPDPRTLAGSTPMYLSLLFLVILCGHCKCYMSLTKKCLPNLQGLLHEILNIKNNGVNNCKVRAEILDNICQYLCIYFLLLSFSQADNPSNWHKNCVKMLNGSFITNSAKKMPDGMLTGMPDITNRFHIQRFCQFWGVNFW